MLTTHDEIYDFLKDYNIHNIFIHKDLSVDVYGHVFLHAKLKAYKEIPVQFGVVKGDFICSQNGLHSLKGSPREVHGSFCFSNNYIRDFTDLPSIIRGDLECYPNPFKEDLFDLIIHHPDLTMKNLVGYSHKIKDFFGLSYLSKSDEYTIPFVEIKKLRDIITLQNKLDSTLDIKEIHNKLKI